MNKVNEEAVEWAKKRLKVKLAPKTAYDYTLKYVKMRNEKRMPGTAENPRTRQAERAAARRCLAAEIMSYHIKNDQENVSKLYSLVLQIQSIADANELAYAEGVFSGKNHPRNGKKASIQKLPDDWQDQMCSIMSKHRYLNAVRILACTGCRPSEIEKGVLVHHKQDGIYFEIKGAKVDKVRGQDWRQIILPKDHQIASKINDGMYSAQKKSISEIITRKGVKLGFEGISAYSFRHQFASDLKASGISEKNIAMAMGHQAEVTQETYGNSGKGKQIILKVTANKIPRAKLKKSKINNTSKKAII
jgi:integrase